MFVDFKIAWIWRCIISIKKQYKFYKTYPLYTVCIIDFYVNECI